MDEVLVVALRWTEVRDIIKDDDKAKRDKIINPVQLRWAASEGELVVSVGGIRSCYLSPWAESDLCNWLGIPVKYFRECPADLKKLQIDWLIKNRLSDETKWRVRLKNKMVRAFVSEHFQPFDNHKVVSLWERNGDPKLFDYELMLDDTFFFLRALTHDKSYSQKQLGGIQAGVFIRNSEVGRSALAMGASVYRLICKNGMVEVLEKKPPLYQRHIWIDENELTGRLDSAVFGALDLAQQTTKRLQKARKIRADLNSIVETLDRFKLNERVQQSIINQFISEADNSAFGVVNAMTAAARDLNPFERHQLEADAWRFLTSVANESSFTREAGRSSVSSRLRRSVIFS